MRELLSCVQIVADRAGPFEEILWTVCGSHGMTHASAMGVNTKVQTLGGAGKEIAEGLEGTWGSHSSRLLLYGSPWMGRHGRADWNLGSQSTFLHVLETPDAQGLWDFTVAREDSKGQAQEV